MEKNLLSIEFAKLLLAEVKAGAGPYKIPVKVHPSESCGGQERHWRKGHLVGTEGRYFIVRPINGHTRDEKAKEGYVKLLKSKTPPSITAIISRLEQEEQSSFDKKLPEEVRTNTLLETALAPIMYPIIDAAIGVEEVEEIVIDVPAQKEEPMSEQTTAAETKLDDSAFRRKLEEFKRLKESIAEEGTKRLTKLYEDMAEAKAMLGHIENEIASTEKELKAFDIEVKKPTSQPITQTVPMSQVIAPQQNRRTGLSASSKPSLAEFASAKR